MSHGRPRPRCLHCRFPVPAGEPAHKVLRAVPFGQLGAAVEGWLHDDCFNELFARAREKVAAE